MPKASPMIRSFNAGEFSELLEGRVDLDRYPSSLRSLVNYIAAPQGPAISRSGTVFVAPVADETKCSALLPFVFSNEQAKVLEFAQDRIRFFDEDGIQVYDAVAADVTSSAGAAIVVNAPGLGAAVGDQVVLSSFPSSYNLNGEIANITAKTGDDYTLDKSYPNETVVDGQVSRVYHVACAYTEAQLKSLRFVQSVDVLYLLSSTARPRKLSRYGDYDWRLETVGFGDGPYMPINDTSTTLTPSATGNAVAELTSNLVSGVTAVVTSLAGDPLEVTATGLGAALGAFVLLSGFADAPSLNGKFVEVVAKSGDDYTLGIDYPSGATVSNGSAAMAGAGGSGNRPSVAGTKSTPVEFLGRDLTYGLDASEFFYAFDNDDSTYWASDAEQEGYIQYVPVSGFVCDGYTIYAAKDNQDTSYTAKDYAPSTFTFEGYDGSGWVVLDEQEDYVLYDGSKSVFIEIDNETAYEAYRLNITKLTRNGLIEPRVRRLVMREKDAASFTLTASAITGINNDTGFQSTDVGRLVRLKGSDQSWRSCEITAVASTTEVTVKLLGEPLLDTKPIKQWRLGYWSDTTGWPAVGTFFEDRFWLAGSEEFPDLFAGSVVGGYETFSQTDTFGVVLDDSAVVGRLNSRRLSRIRWLSSDARGLLLGTGSEEYTISSPNSEPLTARNIAARPATRRGSADVEPVRVDSQTLYVQRGGRAVREFAFVFEADGYKSPSMSQLASHLGAVPFVEMDYAAEPHSIVWVRRSDGSLVGLTYNRDENVVGWHRHDLAGGVIDTLAVVPQKDQLQDALWLVVKRTVNGQARRYVERLTRFWDFDTSLADAHFVDCGLRYEGSATDIVYGLQHLEGETVYGLIDARPVGPLTVTNGTVTLPYEGANIVLGLGYDSEGVLPRLENGAADGTAQGKVKRVQSLVVNVWNSFNGQVGVYNEQEGGFVYEPLEYPGRFDEFEDVELYTGEIGPFNPSPGYDMKGLIAFKRPKESPLPFNIVAIMPQMHTQDR